MRFFKQFPPAIAVPAFYIFISLGMLARFLFGSAFGALFIALLLYFSAHPVTGIAPLSFGELLFWFAEQPETYKVGFVSAAVTVAGFFVAFHTATLSWRQQHRSQLRTQAAGEVEGFFSSVDGLITDAQLYAEDLVRAVNLIQRGTEPREARFAVDWALSKSQEFLSTRNQLSQAQVQIHRLKGRNYTILSSGWGLTEVFDLAEKALTDIGKKMWFSVPIVYEDDPNYIQTFHNQVNVQECIGFIESAERLSGPIAMLAGSIRGYLLAPVIGFNLSMYIELLKNRKEFSEAVKGFHRAMERR